VSENLKIKDGECLEDAPKVVLARVLGANRAAITQASLSALTYIVKRYASDQAAEVDSDGTSIVTETTLTIADCVFDALQSWDEDSTGYNLQVTLPASAFATAGYFYRADIWATPTSGDRFPAAIVILNCKATIRD
jgi:hypothetical protein